MGLLNFVFRMYKPLHNLARYAVRDGLFIPETSSVYVALRVHVLG